MCQTPSTRSVADRPQLAEIGEDLKAPCGAVSDIPDRDITIDDGDLVTDLWAADRETAGDCRKRQAALAAAVNARERQGRHSARKTADHARADR